MTAVTRRRLFFGAIALAAASAPNTSAWAKDRTRPKVAITVDDFGVGDEPMLTGAERDAAIRKALSDRGLQACAFPTGENARRADVASILEQWSANNHAIGNHTDTHPYFSGEDVERLMAEIARAEAELNQYPTYRRWFRFPFLSEGRSAEGRDLARIRLAQAGYRNAHVTIDASDWYIDQRLRRRLAENPDVALAPYRDYYVGHLLDRARFYDRLGRDLTGRSDLPHVLLLHHNLAGALFLADALTAFERNGFELIDIEDAYADPVFDAAPNSLPAGQSLFWAMARANGGYEDRLRWPGEGRRWEEAAMDSAGL